MWKLYLKNNYDTVSPAGGGSTDGYSRFARLEDSYFFVILTIKGKRETNAT